MLRRFAIIAGIAVVVLIITAMAFWASYLRDPTFFVLNNTDEKVTVTAFWRDEEKLLGVIQPKETIMVSLTPTHKPKTHLNLVRRL